jgi:hypothetical protein
LTDGIIVVGFATRAHLVTPLTTTRDESGKFPSGRYLYAVRTILASSRNHALGEAAAILGTCRLDALLASYTTYQL